MMTHRHTASAWTSSELTRATCFAKFDKRMICVSDWTDCCATIERDLTNFARWHHELRSDLLYLSDELTFLQSELIVRRVQEPFRLRAVRDLLEYDEASCNFQHQDRSAFAELRTFDPTLMFFGARMYRMLPSAYFRSARWQERFGSYSTPTTKAGSSSFVRRQSINR